MNEGLAVGVFGSKIVLSGGLDSMENPSNSVQSYDAENNVWTQLPSLPVAFSDHSMFVFNKKLFVLGGWTREGEEDRLVYFKQSINQPLVVMAQFVLLMSSIWYTFHFREMKKSDFFSVYVSRHKVHTNVYSFTKESGTWQKEDWRLFDAKPFQRCVLADGKVFLIGGGCLKASQRFIMNASDEKKHPSSVLKWYDLTVSRWYSRDESGIEESFWDHKAIMAYLPRSALRNWSDSSFVCILLQVPCFMESFNWN